MTVRQFLLAFAILLGLGLAANGIVMLAAPQSWYVAVPGVPTTGPFNQHFIRDIGLIYVLAGLALAAGAVRPVQRATLWAITALWLSGHALFHLWEVAAGICGSDALARDFPAVTLPALVTAALTLWAVGDGRRAAA